jgi:hypothetical protein
MQAPLCITRKRQVDLLATSSEIETLGRLCVHLRSRINSATFQPVRPYLLLLSEVLINSEYGGLRVTAVTIETFST